MEKNTLKYTSSVYEANEVKGVPITFSDEIYSSLVQSTLKLFNAVPVKTAEKKNPTKEIIAKTINHGFILSPEVFANYSVDELSDIIETASEEIGLSPEQMNSSFHKSWKKVRDAPIFQLLIEQIFHYITTYGYERLGIYDKNSVFIPNEELNIPDLKDGIKLVVINGYTKEQLKEKLLVLLESGIALKTIDELVEVATYCELKTKDIATIKNKEVRIRLYDKMNILPELPLEFLRFVIYKTTEGTLLIINKNTIEKIKDSETNVKYLFKQYDEEFGYSRLAEIFLRFKPLFLAFKADKKMVWSINKISHLSAKFHKPMQQNLLNNVTFLLKNHYDINLLELKSELSNVNIFRKIRLASALNYRITGSTSMLYKIRNGKAYAKESPFDNITDARKVYDVVLQTILDDLKHLKGKKFFIPENVKYALPATAKQFTGNIPSGSYVVIPKDMIFGVYWENVGSHRIDLDLSTISLQYGKIGWDARYRTDDRNIMFSGDITDAHDGASELFYVSNNSEDVLLLSINYYNYDKDIPVPFKILVAQEHPKQFSMNYMVNPNNVQCVVKTEIKEKQKILGLITISNKECRFYFSETGLGQSITSSDNKYNDIAREYLLKSTTNMITLNDVLIMVGAKIVNEINQDGIIDLSPEVIEKDTFIRLLTKNE